MENLPDPMADAVLRDEISFDEWMREIDRRIEARLERLDQNDFSVFEDEDEPKQESEDE